MKATKLVILLLLAVVIATYFALGLDQLFSLEGLQEMQGSIVAWHEADPWQSALVLFAAYVAVTGLSLPGALIMSVAAGALFGFVAGTTLVSFASTLGATAAFFLSRHLFRDVVQRRFGRHLEAVNRGVDRDGAWYLLTLRLVPAFPFVVINLIMGLTTIRPLTFMLVSQAGMLAATVLVVNAGTQLAQLDSAADILSPALIGSLTLLAIAPLLIKKVVELLKAKGLMGAFEKPRRFDRNVVVIGAGSAGLVTSYMAAGSHAATLATLGETLLCLAAPLAAQAAGVRHSAISHRDGDRVNPRQRDTDDLPKLVRSREWEGTQPEHSQSG